MAMRNHLTRGAEGFRETKLLDNVVQAGLKELKQDLAGDSTLAQGQLKIAAKLPLEHAVLVAELLLFGERQGVIRQLAPGALWSMLAGWIVFVFKRLGRAVNENAVTAAYFRFGSGITSHVRRSVKF